MRYHLHTITTICSALFVHTSIGSQLNVCFVGYPPTSPRNFTLQSSSIQQGILAVNLTWTHPQQTHGYIICYYVEFYFNETSFRVEKKTKVIGTE